MAGIYILRSEGAAEANYVVQSAEPVIKRPVSQETDSTRLVIYPNPVKNTLHIVVPTRSVQPVRFEIYGMNGILIRRFEWQPGRTVALGVDMLAPGTYILRAVDQSANRWTEKFVKG